MNANGSIVLVVDDDVMMLETLVKLLTHFGFKVLPQDDSVQALATIQERNDIAIVVCDYDMPEVNGEAVARAAKKKNPATPVFVLSGGYPPEIKLAPWDAWFLKGAPVTELIRKLNTVMPLACEAVKKGMP